MRRERGFSLLMVLLVLIALSVVGVATLTLSQTESSVAGARSYRRQALAAAEAGFNHFIGTSPANLAANTYYLGHVGTGPTAFVPLLATVNDEGKTVQAQYRVRTTDAGPSAGSFLVVSEGEVTIDGHVVGRAMVSGIVFSASASGANAVAQGQKSLGAWGTSSNLPARTDISLVDLPGGGE